jgi:hypothetical protein
VPADAQNAGDTEKTNGSDGRNWDRIKTNNQWRHVFMLVLSAAIVGIVLFVSYEWGREVFNDQNETPKAHYLIPYLTNLAGVFLFIMNTARKKRENWEIRKYWGDQLFRVAQSFKYLFVGHLGRNTPANGGAVAGDLGPNILGLFVGMFILRVERAMEGLGDKFEETLMVILPRAAQYVSAEERRRQQLRTVYRIDDITTQYASLRPLIDDPAARDKIDQLVHDAEAALGGEDPDKVKETHDALVRHFEEVRRSVGETLVPIEALIGGGPGMKPETPSGGAR